MLRVLVVAIGGAFVCAGGWIGLTSNAPWPVAVEVSVFGVLILIGTFLEGRYRSSRAGGAGWQTTGERFVDPSTGALTEVTYNPRTGERSYQTAANAEQFPKL